MSRRAAPCLRGLWTRYQSNCWRSNGSTGLDEMKEQQLPKRQTGQRTAPSDTPKVTRVYNNRIAESPLRLRFVFAPRWTPSTFDLRHPSPWSSTSTTLPRSHSFQHEDGLIDGRAFLAEVGNHFCEIHEF